MNEYNLNLQDFLDKADKAIEVTHLMDIAFGNNTLLHIEHLRITIAAACLDVHYQGYLNGKSKCEDDKKDKDTKLSKS